MGAAPSAPLTLPNEFSGWQKTTSTWISRAPWGQSPTLAPALKEFDLQKVERARYQRAGRTLTAQGMLFYDASGAFGAFTLLRPVDAQAFDAGPDAHAEVTGDQILLTRGSWLVELNVDEITAMTASEVRQLAANLPMRGGAADQLPTIQLYLPQGQRVPNSLHYVEGPAAFAAICNWLPAAQVDFKQGAEAALADYNVDNLPDPVPMLVLAYPTPQIARTQFAALSAAASGQYLVRRSGPMLVLVHGAAGAAAQQLLQSVNYDAEVTLTQATPIGVEGLPSLIIAIFLLIALLVGVAIVVGVLTGGVPALLRRLFPNRFQRPDDHKDLIRLNLK